MNILLPCFQRNILCLGQPIVASGALRKDDNLRSSSISKGRPANNVDSAVFVAPRGSFNKPLL